MTASVLPPFDSVESAIADIAAGKLIIVTDDENRENEGDLIMAAEKVKERLRRAVRALEAGRCAVCRGRRKRRCRVGRPG